MSATAGSDSPTSAPGPRAVSLDLADSAEAWRAAGFDVDGATCEIGGLRLHFVGPDDGRGVVAWDLRDLPAGAPDDLDGLVTRRADDEPPPGHPRHPNGVTAVDHMVLLTDDLARTVTAAAHVGLTPRRWRDHTAPDGMPVRQAFLVAGPLVLELVAPADAPDRPRLGVRSFGLALVAEDLDATAAHLGPLLGPVRPAVQPGRRIATLRGDSLGLTTPVAFMSPR